MSVRLITALAVAACLVALVVAWRLTVGGPSESVERGSRPGVEDVSRSDDLVAPESELSSSPRFSERASEGGAQSREAIRAFRIEGRVASSTGEPLRVSETSVVVRDAAQNSTVVRMSLGGTFTLGPLEPGEYTIEAAAMDHETRLTRLTLAGSPRVEHVEMVLSALHQLLVRVRTPRGTPLRDELMSARAWNYSMPLYAVASREPPEDAGLTLEGMERESVAEYAGIGRRSTRSPFGPQVVVWRHQFAPEDAIGVLRVRDLPVHVALVLDSQRIATQWTKPGEREVVFAIGLEDLEALAPSVRMRVVAAESKTPLDGAVVNLVTSTNPHLRESVGSDGVFQRFGIGTGKQKLEIRCRGRVWREIEFEAAAASRVELGDVELEKGRSLLGRLTGEVEESQTYWIELVPVSDESRELARPNELDSALSAGSRVFEGKHLAFSGDDLVAGRWFLRRAVSFSSNLYTAASSAVGIGRMWDQGQTVDPSDRHDTRLPAGSREATALGEQRDEDLLKGVRLASLRAIEVDTTEEDNVEVEAHFVRAGILRVDVGGHGDTEPVRADGTDNDGRATRAGATRHLEVLDDRGFSMARCDEGHWRRAYVALPHGSYTLLVRRDGETTRLPVHLASNLERVVIP